MNPYLENLDRSGRFMGRMVLFFMVAFSLHAQTQGGGHGNGNGSSSTSVTTTSTATGAISGTLSNYTRYPPSSQAAASSSVPPVVMLLVSTDEQLFYKAYTDYTDLTNSGTPDTTYNNSYSYDGYFNPDVCYNYTSSVFVPVAAAASHKCSGEWSGNFMNWVTMSRLDMLRYAMYGGYRTTDTSTSTILTRAVIPNDGHAWVKVYTGTSTNGLVSDFTPSSATTLSLCNAYVGSAIANNASASAVGLSYASGAYTQWASMALSQCGTGSDTNQPSSATKDTVSVEVCDGKYDTRSMCLTYGSNIKPTGVLQEFGESSSTEKLRFAMISGSRSLPRSGGLLRKNAALIAGNPSSSTTTADTGCGTSTNEVDLTTGIFCSTSSNNGIIAAMNDISLDASNNYWSGSSWSGCSTYAIFNRYYSPSFAGNGILDDPGSSGSNNIYHCGAWGNPLAEMYAEALKYFANQSQTTFASTLNGGSTSDGLGMAAPAWMAPLTTANWCASCAIMILSSGQVTFDGDEIPNNFNSGNVTILNKDPWTATKIIGDDEGITCGSSATACTTYLYGQLLTGYNDLYVGAQVNTTADVCTPQTVTNLAYVRGICPDGASMEGSYLTAGLAWQAWVNGIAINGISASTYGRKPVKTYAVAMSESMPTFTAVTSAGNVTLSPLCQSANSATRPAETGAASGYRTCGLLSLQLGQITSAAKNTDGTYSVYGKSVDSTEKSGSFLVVWDDSTWGNDHDLDMVTMVSWCVGSSCGTTSDATGETNICWNTNVSSASNPNTQNGSICSAGQLKTAIGENQVLVRTEVLSAAAGNNLAAGFSISGATANNGAHRIFYRPGSKDYSLLTGTSSYPTSWDAPQLELFTGGGTATGTLENPLWYAAKYGGFTYTTSAIGKVATTTDDVPKNYTDPTVWEDKNTSDSNYGDPKNYFLARNPSNLVSSLESAFESIATSTGDANDLGSASPSVSSQNIDGSGLTYQVQYYQERDGVYWTGGLQAFWLDSSGYLREGSNSNGAQTFSSSADYVITDSSSSVTYRCTTATSTPTTSSSCTAVSTTNPLQPVWSVNSALNAYYDPTASAATINNMAKQRTYSAASTTSVNPGERYIFTYVPTSSTTTTSSGTTSTTSKFAPSGSTANGTVVFTHGAQMPFVWVDSTTGCVAALTGFCGTSNTVTTTTTTYNWSSSSSTTTRTGNYGLLNEQSPALAQSLVNWVRGIEDTTDYRSRTATTNTYTYRLGDIVDSSPLTISAPAERYDLLYSDYTYKAFYNNYLSRRQMVYVGANDGMLHAFNAGFYQSATTSTNAQVLLSLSGTGSTTGDPSITSGNPWALGQEVWAYVPANLLPHLRWLADKSYTHVFYVDGSPISSDVQIFGTGTSTTCKAGSAASSDIDSAGHVCGWGTVLVVPFRLGGGPISVDTIGSGNSSDTEVSNSAYVILDVTDPELPPTVLGEITTVADSTTPTIGTYTTSAPAFAVHTESDGTRHFLLTFGSGPSATVGGTYTTAASASTYLGAWVYDLSTLYAGTSAPVASFTGSAGGGTALSFAGNMAASDFDLNYSAEGIYFGGITNPSTTTSGYGGGLWKIDLRNGTSDTSDPSSWTLRQIINVGAPVMIRPTMTDDSAGRPTIYFGTGRSFTNDDESGSTYQSVQQQYIVGVTDNSLLTTLAAACQTLPVSMSSLVDSSLTAVSSDGTISGSSTSATTLSTLESDETAVSSTGCYTYSGWYLDLAGGDMTSTAEKPSERVIVSQSLLDGILYTTTYTPADLAAKIDAGYSDCSPVVVAGTSALYGLDYLTGTATTSLSNYFGTSSGTVGSGTVGSGTVGSGTVGSGTVNKSVSLGTGKASAPVLSTTSSGTSVLIQNGSTLRDISTGSANTPTSGEISWREVENP